MRDGAAGRFGDVGVSARDPKKFLGKRTIHRKAKLIGQAAFDSVAFNALWSGSIVGDLCPRRHVRGGIGLI